MDLTVYAFQVRFSESIHQDLITRNFFLFNDIRDVSNAISSNPIHIKMKNNYKGKQTRNNLRPHTKLTNKRKVVLKF